MSLSEIVKQTCIINCNLTCCEHADSQDSMLDRSEIQCFLCLELVHPVVTSLLISLSMAHTLTLENGQLLTGHKWRKANPLFTTLPFSTLLLRADENIVEPLENALAVRKVDTQVKEGLMVCQC